MYFRLIVFLAGFICLTHWIEYCISCNYKRLIGRNEHVHACMSQCFICHFGALRSYTLPGKDEMLILEDCLLGHVSPC